MLRFRHFMTCLAVAGLPLILLYWYMNPSSTGQSESGPRSRVFRVWVTPVQVGGQSPTLHAVQGDTVTLVFSGKRTGEIHIHGREERTIELTSSADAKLSFVADTAGLFPVHLHDRDGSMHPLAMLEIQPR